MISEECVFEEVLLSVSVRDERTLEPATEETALLQMRLMQEERVLVNLDGKFESVVKFKPPMCFNSHDADWACSAIDRVGGLLSLLLCYIYFLVGAFSLKEKSPTLTVSSFFFSVDNLTLSGPLFLQFLFIFHICSSFIFSRRAWVRIPH